MRRLLPILGVLILPSAALAGPAAVPGGGSFAHPVAEFARVNPGFRQEFLNQLASEAGVSGLGLQLPVAGGLPQAADAAALVSAGAPLEALRSERVLEV